MADMLGLSGLERGAGREPSGRAQVVSNAGRALHKRRRHQRPRVARRQHLEGCRNHPDHREPVRIEPDAAADDAWITAEAASPDSFTQDDGIGVRMIVGRQKRPAGERHGSENVEKAAGDSSVYSICSPAPSGPVRTRRLRLMPAIDSSGAHERTREQSHTAR